MKTEKKISTIVPAGTYILAPREELDVNGRWLGVRQKAREGGHIMRVELRNPIIGPVDCFLLVVDITDWCDEIEIAGVTYEVPLEDSGKAFLISLDRYPEAKKLFCKDTFSEEWAQVIEIPKALMNPTVRGIRDLCHLCGAEECDCLEEIEAIDRKHFVKYVRENFGLEVFFEKEDPDVPRIRIDFLKYTEVALQELADRIAYLWMGDVELVNTGKREKAKHKKNFGRYK